MSTSFNPGALSRPGPPIRPSPSSIVWRRARAGVVESTWVHDLDALEALRGEWLELLARSRATPFQSPGAILSWARTHAADRTRALVLREDGVMRALVPVFSWEGALLLAGTGPTDYNDGVFEDGRRDLADRALDEVARHAQGAGLARIELRQLRPSSLLLAAGLPAGWRQRRAPDDPCPVAPIEGVDGLGAMPPRRRRKFEAARRRAERDGPAAQFATAGAGSIDATVDHLFDLHARRWAAKGEPGVLREALMAAFIRRAAPALLADGALRLHTLHLGRRPAAVLFALHDGDAAYLYLSGFDAALEPWSPGARLLAYAFGQAAREGLSEAHFLRGREPYKYDWGAVDRPIWRRDLVVSGV